MACDREVPDQVADFVRAARAGAHPDLADAQPFVARSAPSRGFANRALRVGYQDPPRPGVAVDPLSISLRI